MSVDEHPGARPWEHPSEPEHPMVVEGGVVDGDTALMLRCLVEELMMTGMAPTQLRAMSRDRRYQALYAARAALGDARTDEIIEGAGRRVGVHRHAVWESADAFRPVTLTISSPGRAGTKEGA